jgi:class 3 adenylate cyclase
MPVMCGWDDFGKMRLATVDSMTVTPSPEIEAVIRRVMTAYASGDGETMSNLFSADPALRVLGFDIDEWWVGPDEFLGVLEAQSHDWPDFETETQKVEAFQDGAFGWATALSIMTSPETTTPLRHVATLRLEAGAWKVIQWHNSIPVPNRQIWGVDLTTTLDDLVASVLDEEIQLVPAAGAEGTMTLVFTDIVDSTGLAESVGDAAWTEVIGEHESTIRDITTSQRGTVVKLLGDGSMLAFTSARAALRAAVEIQRSNAQTSFDVRIGIHSGEVIHTGEDLFGLTVNKAARVAAVADAGEIMISSTTRDLVGSIEGIRMAEPKIVALKGLSDTHQIVRVEWD